jgi:hypothetical protein
MATTTNYSWETPDDTDLVKDGAAAIRTLGSSIDTTTKALNPSTTLGDIEYRSSTANTNTRLGIGSTGQVLTVSGGVPTWATASSGNFPVLTVSKYGSNFSTSSTSFTDLTGYTITRTPVSGTNNIEIKMTVSVTVSATLNATIRVLQGATTLSENDVYVANSGAGYITLIWYAANVPASSTTFKAQIKVNTGTITVYGVNSGYNSIYSTLEIY